MAYDVSLQQVEPQRIAVVRRRAPTSALSTVVPEACGLVWNFVRAARIPRPDRHVAVYFDNEINMEIGVIVLDPFVGADEVFESATPAGWAATTAHFGPYERLGEAHQAVLDWCAARHYEVGTSWEIYGHWTDDLQQLRTDVYWLITNRTPQGAQT